MQRLLQLCILLALPAAHAAGAVHWYLGSYDSRYVDENAAFVAAHRDAIDGVLHCCTGPTIHANGSVSVDDSLFAGLTSSDRDAGLEPRMLPISPSPYAILARVAGAAVPDLVRWAVKFNISGFVSDYEPHDNTTAEHARAYADFLGALGTALHGAGKKLAVCISDWGILGAPHWPTLAKAGADMYVSMGSTYKRQGGKGDPLGKAQVLGMKAIFPAQALVVGLGTVVPAPQACPGLTGNYSWDEPSFRAFLGWLQQEVAPARAMCHTLPIPSVFPCHPMPMPSVPHAATRCPCLLPLPLRAWARWRCGARTSPRCCTSCRTTAASSRTCSTRCRPSAPPAPSPRTPRAPSGRRPPRLRTSR
jgi:hypothetical protein